jgi:hypothetical protein
MRAPVLDLPVLKLLVVEGGDELLALPGGQVAQGGLLGIVTNVPGVADPRGAEVEGGERDHDNLIEDSDGSAKLR